MLLSIVALFALCNALASAQQVSRYDYIVVGAGTSGLVVAERLSENSAITVAIIEPGESVLNNTNVTSPTGYGLAFGTAIDWQYESVPQVYAGNKPQVLRAGKAVGGTSTINGLNYVRAQDVQIDAWEQLGNDGWNWASLLPYYKKSEYFQIPDAAQRADGANYDPSYHGYSGPQKVGWTNEMMSGTWAAEVNASFANLGLPYNPDENSGQTRGFTVRPYMVDQAEDVRADTARAFYWPNANRPNLSLFTGTTAEKIIWANTTNTTAGSKPTAAGIEVVSAGGQRRTIYANKEVILSAGALRSPLILEYSGVGNPAILQKYGIKVVVSLPTVGENLQDEPSSTMSFSANASFNGSGPYGGYADVSDVFGNSTAQLNATVASSLNDYAKKVSQQSNGTVTTAVLEKLFGIQYDLIFKEAVPITELIVSLYGSTILMSYWGMLPFARGNIHITSGNASELGAINPNYFMLDYDVQQHVGSARLARKVPNTAPLSSVMIKETYPGLSRVPANASDDVWFDFIKQTYRSNFHAVGTAAMMSQDLGGVVDSNLLVYGTSNVRVVDASVVPFQVCGHSVSTLYAVAEKAADAIKAAQ
ncbi:MAG: hypothetical protein M1819_005891 [Sarea resinae]|nr:MAG: hypothetical protein M1819_005891 [Sarea resinae]